MGELDLVTLPVPLRPQSASAYPSLGASRYRLGGEDGTGTTEATQQAKGGHAGKISGRFQVQPDLE
jgi:hypothetical protein